jgi:hypothetical protein
MEEMTAPPHDLDALTDTARAHESAVLPRQHDPLEPPVHEVRRGVAAESGEHVEVVGLVLTEQVIAAVVLEEAGAVGVHRLPAVVEPRDPAHHQLPAHVISFSP